MKLKRLWAVALPRLVRPLFRRMCSHEWELEDSDKWDTKGAGIHAKDYCKKCGGEKRLFIFAGTITESKIHWPNAKLRDRSGGGTPPHPKPTE